MSEVTAAKTQQEAAPADSLVLLRELEPRHRVFLRNLGDLILRREPPPVEITAEPEPLRRESAAFLRSRFEWPRFARG